MGVGTVAQNHSLAWALEGSAGALLLVAAAGVLFSLREPHESEPDSFEQFDTPAVALKLKPRSGPIVFNFEYLVPEENVEALLDLMRPAPACNVPRHSARRPGRTTFAYIIVSRKQTRNWTNISSGWHAGELPPQTTSCSSVT
nr:MFS transporter [Mesorhizobium sp.]